MAIKFIDIRVWLRSKATVITLYAGAFAAVLSVVVYWKELGIPNPATANDVARIESTLQDISEQIRGLEQ
jgi:hypothetical protein